MTEILLVRHCESEANRQPHLICGRSNHIPISERGEQQAALLGTHLRSIGYIPDIVYSSGAERTNATARITLETAQLPVDILIDERLQELSQGDYEGRLRTEVYTPDVVDRYQLTDLHGALPGTESIYAGGSRMHGFVRDIHDKHPDGNILVFSHGLAIRSLAGYILNQSKQAIMATSTDNASLTRITTTDDHEIVHYIGKKTIPEYN